MWFSFFITWEQCKLGDIAIEVNRTDANSNAPIMMITANDGFIEQSERYAFNNAGESLKRYIVLHKGELAYNHGASKLRPYGSCFALINQEKARIPFVYHCFSVENHNSEFVSIELNGNDVESQLRRIVSSGARMDGLLNISFQDYASISILLPEKAEQDKIARVFRNLDNLITLHQRKQNELFLLILGKKTSSILANDWEQRKFGEYFEERNERSGEGELISVTINSGIKKFNELGRFDTKPEDLSKYKRVDVGDIAYNSMRMWQGASGYSPYSGILSPAYTVISPRTGVSSMFFAYLIKRPQMIHLFEINSQGLTSDTWNLKFPAFSQIEASAPTDIAEQKNIAEIFTVLDNLITLHQCKENLGQNEYGLLSSLQMKHKMANDWEQRKFGDIVSVCSGKDYKHLNEGDIPVYGTGGYMLSVSEALSYFDDAIGIGRKGTIDKPYILKAPFWTVDTLFYAVPKEKTALDFVYCLFQIIDWKSKDESTGVPSLSKVAINSVDISVPKSEEQVRIGTVFFKIDNLITLHQCKREAFLSRKSPAFFQFNKGRNTLTWEQCKFAEVYSFASEGGTPDTNTAAYYRNGTIPFVRIEDTENKYIDSVKTFVTEEGLKHSSAWLIPSGSVIFTNGATVGNVAINRIPVATKQGILGIIPHKTVMAEYLYYLLSSGFFQREVRNRQATGTFATIILKNLNEINVFVPDKAEQQKISGYLSSIDNLITLHQRGEKIYNRRQT